LTDSGSVQLQAQFVKAVDRMSVDHALENVAQTSRLDVVRFANLDGRSRASPNVLRRRQNPHWVFSS